MGRPVPDPFGDRLRVLVTVLPATWQPALSRMRLLHREIRVNSRSLYM